MYTAEIKQHGTIKKEMRLEFKNLYAQTILVSVFGEDVSQEIVTLVNIDTGAPFSLTLAEAIMFIVSDSITILLHPIRLLCTGRIGTWRITARERRIRQNALVLRA